MQSTHAGVFVGPITEVHRDARRTIQEGTDGKQFSVQLFDIHMSEIPLGDHYHPEGKTETFIITEGSGHFGWYPVNEAGQKVGEIERLEIHAPRVIYIPPYNVHTFMLLPGSKMIGISSREFRKSDLIDGPEKITF